MEFKYSALNLSSPNQMLMISIADTFIGVSALGTLFFVSHYFIVYNIPTKPPYKKLIERL